MKPRSVWADVPSAHLLVYALSVALVSCADLSAQPPHGWVGALDIFQLPDPGIPFVPQALLVGNCMRPLGASPVSGAATAAPAAAASVRPPTLKGAARIEECKRRVVPSSIHRREHCLSCRCA